MVAELRGILGFVNVYLVRLRRLASDHVLGINLYHFLITTGFFGLGGEILTLPDLAKVLIQILQRVCFIKVQLTVIKLVNLVARDFLLLLFLLLGKLGYSHV